MIEIIEKEHFFLNLGMELAELMLSYYKSECKQHNDEISVDLKASCNNFNPILVGQESNNIFLFTWIQAESPFSKTFLAIYDTTSHKSRLIFTQDKVVTIVNASVNADFTMLAFSVRQIEKSGKKRLATSNGYTYESYIAEIAPRNRVFSLNVEWRTYQKVQFLQESVQSKQKISRLLFFHHKESIAIYDIPINDCNKRFVMSMQPSTRQIIGQFLWAQFDLIHQRLFFVKLYPIDEEEIHAKALFTVVEFKSDGDFEYVLNFPLPISFRMDCMHQQSVYFENYFSSIVAANSFNFEVITVNPSSLYICYQEPTEAKSDDLSDDGDSKSSSSSILSSSSINSPMNVTYVVCCVHGAYKVQCSTSVVSKAVGENRVLFAPFKDLIVAFLPGNFFHLLDISCEHEPVHNILLSDDISFVPKFNATTAVSEVLISKVHNSHLQQTTLFYDNISHKFYQFDLIPKNVFRLFVNAKLSLKIAILHVAMTHFTEKRLCRKIIERICLDPANMETTDLIKEYLVCASYVQMKRMIFSPLDLKIFPFTSQETSRGQVERNENGERTAYLFYKQFPTELVQQIQKVLRQNKSSYWNNIFSHMNYEVNYCNKRFPLKLLNMLGINMSEATCSSMRRRSITTTLSRKVSVEKKLRSLTSSTSSLPSLNENLKESLECEHKNVAAIEEIVAYIVRHFGQGTRSKGFKMCQEYASIRKTTINTFWKMALRALNFSNEDEIYSKSFNDLPSEFELASFQIIERLKFICEQLCHPGFTGMANLFMILAFRCLSKYQFLQYIDACTFDINENIVRQILLKADDTPENVTIKKRLISYLPRETCNSLLKEWGNASSVRFLAQQTMTKLSSEEMHYGTGLEEINESSNEFIPVRTLLHSVKMCSQRTGILDRHNSHDISDETLKLLSGIMLSDTESLILQKDM